MIDCDLGATGRQATIYCPCSTCCAWRRHMLQLFAEWKAATGGAVVLLRLIDSSAAYAVLEDARAINATCGHMIRTDTFGVADVFVCDVEGVQRAMVARGYRVAIVNELDELPAEVEVLDA
jgi:hypothetical protein